MGKNHIRITLSARELEDNPDVLKLVAELARNSNKRGLQFNVERGSDSSPKPPIDEGASASAKQRVADELDANEVQYGKGGGANTSGRTKKRPDGSTVLKSLRALMKRLGDAGWSISIAVVASLAVEKLKHIL